MRKLLKIFFHFLYHPLAWVYDDIAAFVSLNRWNQWRLAAIPHITGSRILELGFGTGHLQVELYKNGFQTFGLDESWQMATIARRNILKQMQPPALVCGVAEYMPFANQSIDGCVATFPSEYIMETRTLAELHRVLKPTGSIVIIPMAWLQGNSIYDRLAKGLFRITGQTVDKTENLEARIAALFNQAGFEVFIQKQPVRSDLILVITAKKYNLAQTISTVP